MPDCVPDRPNIFEGVDRAVAQGAGCERLSSREEETNEHDR